MKLLANPTGPEAVRDYRFNHALLGQETYDGDAGRPMVRWLEKHGMEWSAYWTNGYTRDYHAMAAMMQQFDIPIVVDVDDHFEGVDKGNGAYAAWHWERKNLYRAMLKNADRRVASTPFLAERHDCALAPNFVRPEQWDWPVRERRDDSVVLLHAGSIQRAEDYLQSEKAFRAFLDLPNTKIVFMGWMPAWAKDYPVGRVVFFRWAEYEKYHRMMRWIDPDILVSPMVHTDFNVAKSNLKWLEAAMVGACFVGERWGEYSRTVKDGETGILADGLAEWRDVLTGLALDAVKRQEVAEAGRREVLCRWTWEHVGPQWRKAVLGEE